MGLAPAVQPAVGHQLLPVLHGHGLQQCEAVRVATLSCLLEVFSLSLHDQFVSSPHGENESFCELVLLDGDLHCEPWPWRTGRSWWPTAGWTAGARCWPPAAP